MIYMSDINNIANNYYSLEEAEEYNFDHRKKKKVHLKKIHNKSYFNQVNKYIERLDKEVGLSGGRSTNPYPSFRYPTRKPKNVKPGTKVDQNDNDDNTPKGYHWKNGTGWKSHYVTDYENTDIFNHFDGNFFLRKVGNKFTCWIQLVEAAPITTNGSVGKEITKFGKKKYCESSYTDKDKSKSFPLASIAAHFEKHNIYEDTTQFPHVYHDVNMGCGAVKYWNIIDGGNNNPNKPHIIAHAGETIIIDTGRMKVRNIDGTDLTKYTSFGSTFPPLEGGKINHINFYPTVGSKCDVDVTYVPRIK